MASFPKIEELIPDAALVPSGQQDGIGILYRFRMQSVNLANGATDANLPDPAEVRRP